MAKFNEQIIQKCVDWVCENGLIDYGGAKLIDFCNVMGIGKSTYYRWMENETFGTAIKRRKKISKTGWNAMLFPLLQGLPSGMNTNRFLLNTTWKARKRS